MRSTERFVQMTGLLLALIGSLAPCGVCYVSVTNKFTERAGDPLYLMMRSLDRKAFPNHSAMAQLPD
jgi:hypothetical protein